MKKSKAAKPLTKQQYIKKFSRAARWRLLPQEASEAIADYQELIFQEGREEEKLVEELGSPVQAVSLLTDTKTYRRWLWVFGILTFGLILQLKWVWMGHSIFYFNEIGQWWYPVWAMAVGLILSSYWFRRHGQKNGPLSKGLIATLAAVFLFGAGVLAWLWHITGLQVLQTCFDPNNVLWNSVSFTIRSLMVNGGRVCILLAFVGLILARVRDRRWLALYALGITMAAICSFLIFYLRNLELWMIEQAEWGTVRSYLFFRLLPVEAAGLIGMVAVLC